MGTKLFTRTASPPPMNTFLCHLSLCSCFPLSSMMCEFSFIMVIRPQSLPSFSFSLRCQNGENEYAVHGCFGFEGPAGKMHRLQHTHEYLSIHILR